MVWESAKLKQRGTLTIPKAIRDQIGLVEGSVVVFEITREGLLLRPAVETPVLPEQYTAMRKAEFLLSNAVDEKDYQRAREEVQRLGLDPDTVPHQRPSE